MKSSERALGSILNILKAAVYKLALVVILLSSLFVVQNVAASTIKCEQAIEQFSAQDVDIFDQNNRQTVFHCKEVETGHEEFASASLASNDYIISDDVKGEASKLATCTIFYQPTEIGSKGGQQVPPSKNL